MGLGMRRGGRRGARRAHRRQRHNRQARNRRHHRHGRRAGIGFGTGRRLGRFNFGGVGVGGRRVGFRHRFAVGVSYLRGRRSGVASVGSSVSVSGDVSGGHEQCPPMAQLIVVVPIAAIMLIAGIVISALSLFSLLGYCFMGIGGFLLAICLVSCSLQCFDDAEDEPDVEAQSRAQSELSVVSTSSMNTVTQYQQSTPMSILQGTYNQQPASWSSGGAPQPTPYAQAQPQQQAAWTSQTAPQQPNQYAHVQPQYGQQQPPYNGQGPPYHTHQPVEQPNTNIGDQAEGGAYGNQAVGGAYGNQSTIDQPAYAEVAPPPSYDDVMKV